VTTRSIRTSLISAFALVIVLGIILLGGFTLALTRNNLVSNAEASAQQVVSQLQRVVDTYIGYMEDIARVVVGNGDVRDLVGGQSSGAEGAHRVAGFLQGIRAVRRDIDSIVVVPASGRLVTSETGRPLNRHWVRPDLAGALSPARIENLFDDRYSWVVSLFEPIAGTEAFVQVDLNYGVINDLCRQVQLGRSGYVFIVNGNGDIVYHPRQQLIYSNLKTEPIDDILKRRNGELRARVDGQDRIYSFTTSPVTSWTVVGVSYAKDILSSTADVEYSVWMVALGCVLVTVIVAWAISLRISRPIEALRKSMQAVETGNFDVTIAVDANNEIGLLARDCDIAIRKVRDLLDRNEAEQEHKRRLSLLMLQSQINPHFLYNTLDSIIWMIELGETRGAIEMTSSLAKFFRLGISRGSEIISIRHEISHIESYLNIQKMRYKNKLSYSIEVDAALYGYQSLKLLLQPLVENALYHGLKAKEGPGTIWVKGRLDGGSVLLIVEDDGVGMSSAKREGLLFADSDDDVDHTGVRNVHERVQLYFGRGYGLRFYERDRGGTAVEIELPAIRDSGDPS
jgi:two-component system sensor histidine kinase YesM